MAANGVGKSLRGLSNSNSNSSSSTRPNNHDGEDDSEQQPFLSNGSFNRGHHNDSNIVLEQQSTTQQHLSTCRIHQTPRGYIRTGSSSSLPALMPSNAARVTVAGSNSGSRTRAEESTSSTSSTSNTSSNAATSATSANGAPTVDTVYCTCHVRHSYTADAIREDTAANSAHLYPAGHHRIPLSSGSHSHHPSYYNYGSNPNHTCHLLSLSPSLAALDPFLLDQPPSNNSPPLVPRDALVHSRPVLFQNMISPVTPVSSAAFVEIVQQVRLAIQQGIYPTRISQGSSGSYFCRDTTGRIIGVFKPKNEEPYGNMNPKWTKWLHRNLFPCCFGRTCIIPNQGYVSEAAASYLDRRLGLNIVPRTEIVCLSSPTFHYSFRDRWAYRIWHKELPLKTGSFQLFLNGYKDATTFFRQGYDCMRTMAAAVPAATPAILHSPSSQSPDANPTASGSSHPDLQPGTDDPHPSVINPSPSHPLGWSSDQQMQFQLGFERLVILDFLIRNTDRSSDNWMVKCPTTPTAATTAPPPPSTLLIWPLAPTVTPSPLQTPDAAAAGSTSPYSSTLGTILDPTASSPSAIHDADVCNNNVASNITVGDVQTPTSETGLLTLPHTEALHLDDRLQPLSLTPTPSLLPPPSSSLSVGPTGRENKVDEDMHGTPDYQDQTTVHIAAIDNGLAFPTHHPDRMRSYPYSWSFLPIAHTPFSPQTAHLVLPLLTSPGWWESTLHGLETLLRLDRGFQTKLWRKQRSVVRGQGHNLVEVLGKVVVAEMEDGTDLYASVESMTPVLTPLSGGGGGGGANSTMSTGAGLSPWHLVRRPVVLVHEEVVEEEVDSDLYSSGDEHDAGTENVYEHHVDASYADEEDGNQYRHHHGDSEEYDALVASSDGNHGHAGDSTKGGDAGRLRHLRDRTPSFMQRQKKKLRKVRRRLETLTLRQPCCTHW
ncbi:hypothetical protein BASA62_006560 [Batrachochytrium salamandrivorans]|nr:hypothetical protein BASA62_006560 [Batrachochytrium salamandrivorans]